LRRKISLTIIFVLVAAFAALNHGCSKTNDLDAADENFDLDLNNPNLKEKLGEDDGYSIAVFYGADIHGSLETCG
jgi:hypothetical protein